MTASPRTSSKTIQKLAVAPAVWAFISMLAVQAIISQAWGQISISEVREYKITTSGFSTFTDFVDGQIILMDEDAKTVRCWGIAPFTSADCPVEIFPREPKRPRLEMSYVGKALFHKRNPKLLDYAMPCKALRVEDHLWVMGSNKLIYAFNKNGSYLGNRRIPLHLGKQPYPLHHVNFFPRTGPSFSHTKIYLHLDPDYPFHPDAPDSVYIAKYNAFTQKGKPHMELERVYALPWMGCAPQRTAWEWEWYSTVDDDQRLFVSYERSHVIIWMGQDGKTLRSMGVPGQHVQPSEAFHWDSAAPPDVNIFRAYLLQHHYSTLYVDDSSQLLFRSYFLPMDSAALPNMGSRISATEVNAIKRMQPCWLQVYDAKTLSLLGETEVPYHEKVLHFQDGLLLLDGGRSAEGTGHVVHTARLGIAGRTWATPVGPTKPN